MSDGQEALAATSREEVKLRMLVFGREVQSVPGQSLSVLLRV
jgi:hypothetical protein